MYKRIIRPLLFRLSPETAHLITFKLLKVFFSNPVSIIIIKSIFNYRSDTLNQKIFGIHFPNPVGLAAGFDKDAEVYDVMAAFGFGFIEIGTVTPLAQPGNPKPRMFRLPADRSIINRMGFNNTGVDAVVKRLKKNKSIIIGGNIGKNKKTENKYAVKDYEVCFEKLFNVVDYFIVNVSSPNTPGLRELQNKEWLFEILQKLQALNNTKSKSKPILLKIAPDLDNQALDEIIDVCIQTKIAGIIATNTTISREGLNLSESEVDMIGAGGLSGSAIRERSTQVIKYIRNKVSDDFVIIGVGGIMDENDALDKIKAGANLIQLYTGLIYEGPGLVSRVNTNLAKHPELLHFRE